MNTPFAGLVAARESTRIAVDDGGRVTLIWELRLLVEPEDGRRRFPAGWNDGMIFHGLNRARVPLVSYSRRLGPGANHAL
jgi:hypothetical protein